MLTPISKMVRDSRVAQSPPTESCFIAESLRWSSEGRPWLEVQMWGHGHERAA